MIKKILWKTMEGNTRLKVRARVRVRVISLNSEFAVTKAWCKMLLTLLGLKKCEEEMSDLQPLTLYSTKKWRFQKDRKTPRKNNKNNKFPLLKCSSWQTEVWN